MDKIPSLKFHLLLKLLSKIGFFEVSQSGSHLKLKDNRSHIVIVPVHSNKDIPKGTLLSIIRQAGLTRDEFLKLYYKK